MRFHQGQRVHVNETVDGIALHADGTVARVRSDGGAWVALDARSKVAAAHPFDADDPRGRYVQVAPTGCRLSTRTAADRRRSARATANGTVGPVPIERFGHDHWSTFGYLECRIVDASGVLNHAHMRCDPKRHPFFAHVGSASPCSATLLAGRVPLRNHDDWDCVDDLEAAGLVENIGTGVNPVFRLSELGRVIAARIRAHKANGGTFANFRGGA